MKFLKYIKKQLQNRPDSEHKQAILRLAIVSTGVIYGVYILYYKGSSLSTVITISSSFLISLLIVAHVIWKPQPSAVRRIVGALQDNIFTTLFLYVAGADAAIYLFVYPFITVGNGFRFGVKYLAFSGVLGMICLSYLVFYNDMWAADKMLGIGMLLSNVTVTLYTGILLTKLKQVQNKLEVMATHDVLTGLPNRAYFMQKLDGSFLSSKSGKHGVVCIYFDLDGFKAVNDTHGHKIGDHLLQTVANNIKSIVRSTDTFARLGGDEFTLLLDSKASVDDAILLSQRVIKTIESIKELNGKQIKVSCSIGIAYLPASSLSSSKEISLSSTELLKIADEAMYKAKKSGKGKFELTHVEFAPPSKVKHAA